MKILLIGASGAVGTVAIEALSTRHAQVSNEAVGLAYSKAVEGCFSGRVFIVE